MSESSSKLAGGRLRLPPFVRSTLALATALALQAGPVTAASPADPGAIEEIVVTGDLRESTLLRAPVSVSVIGSELIEQRSASHL